MKKNKSKQNIIVGILVSLVIIVLITDLCLVIINKMKNETGNNTTELDGSSTHKKIITEKIVKRVDCSKPQIEYTNEEMGITYLILEDNYSFFVTDKSLMIANEWLITTVYNSKEEVDKMYDYYTNNDIDIQKHYVKDDVDFIITYFADDAMQRGNQNYQTYGQDYLDYLNKIGYTCKETPINSNEELYE